MLLTELKNFPEKHDSTFSDALQQFIEKHGIKKFEGGQAVVIDRGSHVWRAWFDDPGYERFLKYIEANYGNKFLPKILSKVREEPIQFKRMPKGKTIKYVKIEKLTQNIQSGLSAAVEYLYMNFLKPADLPDSGKELANITTKLKIPRDVNPDDLKTAILKNQDFFTVVLDLIKHHDANDINSENVMFRGSTPVIIDPFRD